MPHDETAQVVPTPRFKVGDQVRIASCPWPQPCQFPDIGSLAIIEEADGPAAGVRDQDFWYYVIGQGGMRGSVPDRCLSAVRS